MNVLHLLYNRTFSALAATCSQTKTNISDRSAAAYSDRWHQLVLPL